MTWQTFWLEPTGRDRRGLRRYAKRVHRDGMGFTCADGHHSAFAWTGEEVDTVTTERGTHAGGWPEPPHDDPRWPTECDEGCGYQFTETDHWQPWSESLYRRTDTGELRVLHWRYAPPDAPSAEPGAMWDAPWLPRKGPDGIALMVRCPHPDGSPGTHDWPIDEPSSGPGASGGFWSRTGEPRQANVTVTPSIAIGDPAKPGYYHGYLQSGVLTDHIG